MVTSRPDILITGHRGQLGRELSLFLSGNYRTAGFDMDTVDITDREATRQTILRLAPRVVLHTAAYTDVDKAESEPERAMEVNADGTRNVALACREAGARLIYYSTDYVFAGNRERPYDESDLTDPINTYGKSKLEGERLATEIVDDAVVMRIAWLYSHHGRNFVNTILKLAHEHVDQAAPGAEAEPLAVVNDQTGNPCWTREVVRQTEVLINSDLSGIFHAVSGGQATWHDLATQAVELSGLPVAVEPCASGRFPRPARRPPFSVLEPRRLKEEGIYRMADWRSALRDFFAKFDEIPG